MYSNMCKIPTNLQLKTGSKYVYKNNNCREIQASFKMVPVPDYYT